MYDVAVIGGGPAGITAGIYSARAGLKTIIFEEKFFGGQIINSHKLDNYPGEFGISGYDFADKLLSQLKEFDVDIKNTGVKECDLKGEIKKIKTRREEFEAKFVIIATGASPRKLGIEREEELTGLGVSYCATCDGAFFKDKTVAVVGGGNTALDDAIYLSSFAKKVYLIHRRNEFRADKVTEDKVRNNEKIELCLSENVIKLLGEDKLSGIILESGREISVDGIFIAIGNVPKTDIFKNELELKDGFIITDNDLRTNIKGVYGAGDVTVKKLRQVVTAVNDGALAVSGILEEI